MGSPFDYPLSSRLDENDAILIFDEVLVPWENVFVYGDVDKINAFFPRSGFIPRFTFHGCTRLAVKLDFIAGLLLKAVEATGHEGLPRRPGRASARSSPGATCSGASRDAMARTPGARGSATPCCRTSSTGMAYRVFATTAYPRVKEIIEQDLGSGLIYLNSHAVDFKTPEMRPLPRPVRPRLQRLRRRRAREADEAACGTRSAPSSAAATSSTSATTPATTRTSGWSA